MVERRDDDVFEAVGVEVGDEGCGVDAAAHLGVPFEGDVLGADVHGELVGDLAVELIDWGVEGGD